MSNNNLNSQLIKQVLKQVIVDSELISAIVIKDNNLNLVIDLPENASVDQEKISQEIKQILLAEFSALEDVRVIFSKKIVKPEPQEKVKQRIPRVKKIILLASAKGGVGKSTTATNIALALSELGFKVGLVDADIYGPTVPKLLDIQQNPEALDGKMLPIFKRGIYSISIGYIIDEARATIWRGPMVSKSLYQLLLGVTWPELDYLIVDMPPGTGDIYLSLAENFVIDGVLLITTPQNIAITMLKKSIDFFNKTNIPIIGVIENMSYFFDPETNIKHHIFGSNLTKEIDLPILGQIPLIPKISQFSDQGLSLIKEKEFLPYIEIAKKAFLQ